MNRFLADTLNVLNGLIAVIIIVVSARLGMTTADDKILGLLGGSLVGLLVAAFACGTISYLCLIERHLSELAEPRRGFGKTNAASDRNEPSL